MFKINLNKTVDWLKYHRPVITTQNKRLFETAKAFMDGCVLGAKLEQKCSRSAIKPVIHDLEKLRANTWDQNKITHIQQWLKDNFLSEQEHGKR